MMLRIDTIIHTKHATLLLYALLGLSLCGCGSTRQEERVIPPSPPDWWRDARQDDEQFIYVKASEEGYFGQEEAATQKAYQKALAHISKRFMSKVRVNESGNRRDVTLKSKLSLKNTRIHHPVVKRDSKGRVYVWLQVSWPKEEWEKQEKSIRDYQRLSSTYVKAKVDKDYGEAARCWRELFSNADTRYAPFVNQYDLLFDYASFLIEAKRYYSAKAYLDEISNSCDAPSSILEKVRKKRKLLPDQMKSEDILKDVLADRGLALLILDKDGALYQYSRDMYAKFADSSVPNVTHVLKTFPDNNSLQDHCEGKLNCDYLLTIVATDTTASMFRKRIPAVQIRWKVTDVDDMRTLGSGRIIGMWPHKHQNPGKMAALNGINILIVKYLGNKTKWKTDVEK